MPCVEVARYAETWAGYIAMERTRRNVREARSLYKRCHSRRLQDGGQAAICMAWLRFEREEGRCAATPLPRARPSEVITYG